MNIQKNVVNDPLSDGITMKKFEADSLLIMSSGKVNSNLFGDLGPILTSDIPLGNLLLIQVILEHYSSAYKKVYVTLDNSKVGLAEILVAQFPNLTVFFADSQNTIGVVIKSFLEHYQNKITQLDILYGDTLSSSLFDSDCNRNIIMVAQNIDSNHWDKVTRTENKRLDFLNQGESFGIGGTISGGFRIIDPHALYSALCQVSDVNLNKNYKSQNTFYSALEVYERASEEQFVFIEDLEWQDSGHIDTYFELRRKLMHKAFRSFNSVTLSESSKWVTKSGEVEKISSEFLWFEKFPKELSHYLPRISSNTGNYSTEFLASLPISDMWLSENNDDAYWLGFVQSLSLLLDDFQTFTVDESQTEIYKNKKSVYVIKFAERIEMLEKLFASNGLALSRIQLDTRKEISFDTAIREISEIGEKVSHLAGWSLMHGDMCFSNLLYERRSKGIKIIDPRGSFGARGIYGDPVYELLKLSQCALGDYDFIAANLFKVSINSNSFELKHLNYQSHGWLKNIFGEFLQLRASRLGLSFEELRILEAGLFLSAAPLHPENSRFIALAIKGLEIYGEYTSK